MMRSSARGRFANYVAAAGFVAVAFAARLALAPLLGLSMPVMTFFPAIMASGWLGGFRAGAFATVAGGALALWFFIPPTYSSSAESVEAVTGLALYGGVGLLIAWLAASYRRVTGESHRSRASAAASSERLQELLDSIGDGFAAIDSSWRFDYVNRTAEKLIGRASEVLLGQELWTVAPALAGGHSETAFRRTMAERIPSCAEVEVPGQQLWLDVRVFPARDGGVTVYLTDITGRKRVETELASTRRQSEDILNSVRESFIALDRDWRFTWLNDRVARTLGCTREELIGRNLWEITPTARNTAFYPNYRRVMEERIPLAFEVDYPNGRWYEVHAYPTEQGLTAYILDITDRKHVEEELQRRDVELRTITDNVPVIVSYLDREGRFRRVNRVYEDVFGKPADSVIGRTLSEVAGEPHWSLAKPWLERALRGERVSFDSRVQHQDGQAREVHVTYTPLRAQDGSVDGVIAMVSDVTERRRAEAALRSSEEKYRFLAEALPQFVWTRNAANEIDYINRHWEVYSGLSMDDANSGKFLECIHPDDRVRVQQALSNLQGRREYEVEYRFRRASDGAWRWHLARSRYFERDRRWLGTAIDIHDRKQAEFALREAEEQLRLITDALPVLIAYVDAEGYYRFNNRTYERWFQLSVDAVKGRHVRDVIGERAYRDVLPRMKSVLSGNAQTFEAELPYLQGVRDVQVAYVPDTAEDGRVRGYFALVEDISERKRAEQALRASERNYSALAETMPAIVWTADSEGRNTYFNSRWMLYTGALPKESRDSAWISWVHPETADAVAQQWRQAVASGEPFEMEYQLRGADGGYRWFLSRAVPVRDDNGRIIQWLGTSTDIDARKRAESDLRATNETLSAFINACPLAVMVLDETGVVQLWSTAAERLYGWTGSEVLGRYLPAVPERDRPDFDVYLRRMFDNKESHAGLSAVRYRKDGSTFDARIWTALLPARLGRRHCLSIVDDVTEERRAETALRESEARFRTMADHAPVLVWMSTADGNFTWFNKPWLEFTGRTLEQESGRGWADGIHPGDSSRCLEICERAFEGRESFAMEYRLRRYDGEYRWVLGHGVPLLTPDGLLTGFIGSCIDITGRRAAEQALRESEERLRLALSAARMAIWDWDLTTGKVTWSDDLTSMSGLDSGRFGATYEAGMGTVHPDDFSRVEAAVKASLEENVPYEAEYRVMQPDGGVRWILGKGHVVRDQSGTPLHLTGVALDTTERRVAEEALRQSEERLRLAQEASEVGIWDWDLRTDALTWSPEIYDIVGVERNVQPTTSLWQSCLHPEDRDKAIAALNRTLEKHEPLAVEFRIVQPDGGVRWLLSRGKALVDESGRAVRLIGVNLDLTERRLVEERLLRTNAELEQYAYAASHDLQEPLRMVRLYTELLTRRYGDVFDGNAKVWFDYIGTGATRMQTLIDDLLAYSLLIGERERHFLPVDMMAVVRSAEESLKVALGESGCRIDCDPMPYVLGEFAALVAVMQNLMSNAIKYRNPARAPHIQIRAERDGDFLRFAVQDNGIGIRPEYHGRIFGVFKRLHGKQIPGNGIGLAICKRTVEQHGGRIWVESQEGHGATFYFTLRTAETAADAATSN